MKFIFELVIAVIVIFFLWNFLKRIFFSSFYKFPRTNSDQGNSSPNTKKNLDSRINWDAETVEYEEIKEKKDTQN